MTSTTKPTRPVITGWSAVSPFGIGKAPFVEGVAEGRTTAAELDREQWAGPDETACLVPGFALREVLGKKGTRSMDRVTGLAVTAVGELLRDEEGGRLPTGEGTALVLGTTNGSVRSMMDFTHTSLVGERPYYVDPSLMPNAVMNCAAGQCAIWYELKGPNTTLAGGRVAGLTVLNYAGGLLATGRAETVLAGAVEEFSTERAWLNHHRRGQEPGAPLGEGCAIFHLEPAGSPGSGRRALAEVLAIESRVHDGGDLRPVLTACLDGVLARGEVDTDRVWAVFAAGLPGALGTQEREVLGSRFATETLDRAKAADLLGDTASVSAAFQIGALLSLAERGAAPAGSIAVISAVDEDGLLACAALRLL